jgi:hypothetical protein
MGAFSDRRQLAALCDDGEPCKIATRSRPTALLVVENLQVSRSTRFVASNRRRAAGEVNVLFVWLALPTRRPIKNDGAMDRWRSLCGGSLRACAQDLARRRDWLGSRGTPLAGPVRARGAAGHARTPARVQDRGRSGRSRRDRQSHLVQSDAQTGADGGCGRRAVAAATRPVRIDRDFACGGP